MDGLRRSRSPDHRPRVRVGSNDVLEPICPVVTRHLTECLAVAARSIVSQAIFRASLTTFSKPSQNRQQFLYLLIVTV